MILPADQETNPDDDKEQEVTPTTRNISITVTNNGDSVGNATVTIGSITGTTGPRGAACTLENVPDGKQNVVITAEGYVDKTEEITVSADNTSFTIEVTAEAASGNGTDTGGD